MDFIPADESTLFIKGFRIYTRLLFRRRFHRVWLKQEYSPCSVCKTVYFLNHHSWWDGLIPFLLNEYRFRQQARAMMEDQQMRQYSFFKKIGAFSINRNNPKQIIRSLRYAVNSFERPHSSLFIYPEGKISPQGSSIQFEGGLAWLYQHLEDVDFVPIGIYLHTIRHDKPELHLHVGKPLMPDQSLPREQLTHVFERRFDVMMEQLQSTAGFNDSEFEKFL